MRVISNHPVTSKDAFATLQPEFQPTAIKRPAELIAQFERAFYGPLPADYAEFLLADGRGARPATNVVGTPPQAGDVEIALSFLYGLDAYRLNSQAANRTYQGRFPPGLITIGTSSVDQICLDVAGLRPGTIYYWDHEREVDAKGRKQPDFSNTIQLANSFTELLQRTKVVNEPERKGAGIVKASYRF